MAEMTFGQMREHAEKHGGFTPLPIGTYNMVIESTEVKPGKNGMAQIMGRLVVLDGPLANKSTLNRFSPYKNDGDPNGMFFQQLAALGLGSEDPVWAQVESVPFEQGVALLAGAMLGRQAIVEITHSSYGGVMRDNVKTMKPIGALIAQGTPPSPGAVPAAPQAPVVPAAASPSPTAVTPPTQVAPQPVVVTTAAPVQPVPVAPAPVAAPAMPAPVTAPVAPVMPGTAPVAAPVAAAPPVVAPEPETVMPAPEATPAASPEAVVAQFPTPPDKPF